MKRVTLHVPRYFFDLHNDFDAIDPEGKEIADLAAAKAAALVEAREMIQASISENGKVNLRHHIDVRDESGAILFVMHFEDAVTIKRGTHVLSGPMGD